MSTSDVSSSFSFSGLKPSISPNGHFIAYLNTSKLIIRSSVTLERIRTIDILPKATKNNTSESYLKISQISWEPLFKLSSATCKIALLLDSTSQIRIFDILDDTVDITITESDVFGIESFEWLKPLTGVVETAYSGAKQIAVFLKNGLYLKVYSLDYKREIIEIEKPLFNKLYQRSPDQSVSEDEKLLYHVFAIGKANKVHNLCLINDGSSSEVLYRSVLGTFLNLEDIKISPNGNWILTSDSNISGIKIEVFSIMGDLSSSRGSLFQYIDDSRDQLGVTSLQFYKDNTILVGDHKETINLLQISNDGLKLKEIYKHKPNIDSNDTKIWRQHVDNAKLNFKKSQMLFKIPLITNLDLYEKGVSKLASTDSLIFSVVNTMPTTVFVWSTSEVDKEPIEIIVTNNRIKDITTRDEFPGFVLITCEDSILLWSRTLAHPISVPYPAEDGTIRGVEIIRLSIASITLLVWDTGKNFRIIQTRLTNAKSQFDHLDLTEIEQIRKGSPVLTDDLSRVVELAAGVQQSEWGQNLSRNLHNEDTFLTKKRQRK